MIFKGTNKLAPWKDYIHLTPCCKTQSLHNKLPTILTLRARFLQKQKGEKHVIEILRRVQLDFFLLISSTSSNLKLLPSPKKDLFLCTNIMKMATECDATRRVGRDRLLYCVQLLCTCCNAAAFWPPLLIGSFSSWVDLVNDGAQEGVLVLEKNFYV